MQVACDNDLWPNCGTSWIGSSCFSAVILLHQVHEYQKLTALLTTFCYTHSLQLRTVYKQVSTLHVLCSDVCCIADIIIWRSLSSFAEDSTFTSTLGHQRPYTTFWLTPSLPQCLPWLRMLSTLSSNLRRLFWASWWQKSWYKLSVNYSSLVWIWIRSRGGHQVCESNESQMLMQLPANAQLLWSLCLHPGAHRLCATFVEKKKPSKVTCI